MNKSRRCFTLLFLLLLSRRILPVTSESEKQQTTNEAKPSPFQFVSNTLSLLKKAHKNSVEKIKTIVHDFRLQYTSPKPDEAAVKKNMETNKGNVEETAKPVAETEQKTAKPATETEQKKTAKSAAETEQKTADKVEEGASDKKESRDEL